MSTSKRFLLRGKTLKPADSDKVARSGAQGRDGWGISDATYTNENGDVYELHPDGTHTLREPQTGTGRTGRPGPMITANGTLGGTEALAGPPFHAFTAGSGGSAMIGPQGPPGPTGMMGAMGAPGLTGRDGRDGLSAYDLAVQGGYRGDMTTWLQSLRGPAGPALPEAAYSRLRAEISQYGWGSELTSGVLRVIDQLHRDSGGLDLQRVGICDIEHGASYRRSLRDVLTHQRRLFAEDSAGAFMRSCSHQADVPNIRDPERIYLYLCGTLAYSIDTRSARHWCFDRAQNAWGRSFRDTRIAIMPPMSLSLPSAAPVPAVGPAAQFRVMTLREIMETLRDYGQTGALL